MVIPIHDTNPVRRTPWITYLLIAANIVVFVLAEPVVWGGGIAASGPAQLCRQEAFFDRYAAIPTELVHERQLAHPVEVLTDPVSHQSQCGVVSRPTYDKVPWRSVLYAMFLHGGWLHLLGNMLFLYVFGNNVEDRLGRLRYLAFYLGCGYIAAYGFAVANAGSTAPLIGASGAIAGVLGAYLVLYPKVRVTSLVPFLFFLPVRLPAWLVLGSWFLLQWLYSAGAAVAGGAGVAYLAHVVGFLVGALTVLVLGPRRRPRPSWRVAR
ncbi:MAG TPA: rhomboid family intramembrane serine protease [Mycobacteriales bacterium]|nr:rhomboid family intramembrane serine protease [Mycobacteriales bacterium]